MIGMGWASKVVVTSMARGGRQRGGLRQQSDYVHSLIHVALPPPHRRLTGLSAGDAREKRVDR